MEKTTKLIEGVDMNVNDQLSITFLPDEGKSSSYNTLRLNFSQIGGEEFSISMTPCEALDIISALGIAVQFYLHNQTQYKNDVVTYLIDKKESNRDEYFHINRGELKDINKDKRIESYDDIYSVVSMLGGEDKEIMQIITEVLDSINRIKPEIYNPESYYLSFFDIFGIYDNNIKFLYNEVCDNIGVNILILFISMGMGITSYKEIMESIVNRTRVEINFTNLIKLIQKELPLFTVLGVE
jgi:hypothetical protein